jgi:hypothetical protein
VQEATNRRVSSEIDKRRGHLVFDILLAPKGRGFLRSRVLVRSLRWISSHCRPTSAQDNRKALLLGRPAHSSSGTTKFMTEPQEKHPYVPGLPRPKNAEVLRL